MVALLSRDRLGFRVRRAAALGDADKQSSCSTQGGVASVVVLVEVVS